MAATHLVGVRHRHGQSETSTKRYDIEPDRCGGCYFDDPDIISRTCGSMGQIAIFMSLLDLVIRSQCSITDPCRRIKNSAIAKGPDETEYDFVVVGAGVAGSVVASRLSENNESKVLLLEAGPEEPTMSSIPAFSTLAIGTYLDWKYKTVPQKNACLSTGGICEWPRGKMIGGTGSMSGMMYTTGNSRIYDQWAKDGNKGWSYKEVLPFFKRLEHNLEPPENVETEYHGFEGPMVVQQFPHQPEIVNHVLAAAEELGYRVGDLNGVSQTGFSVAPVMQKDGLRASSARMYLRPVLSRKNLRVRVESTATRILFDSSNKLATGVEYVDADGNTRTVRVKKEVVLSAGVVGSAQLLMLSGIGPEEDLSKVHIRTIRNLPVGRNLHHHVSVGMGLKIDGGRSDVLSLEALNKFVRYRSGPLSSTGLTQLTAFLESSKTTSGLPDIQLYMDGFHYDCDQFEAKYNRGGKLNGSMHITLRPAYLLSKSRGYIKLKSKNPLDHPEIDPKYLSDEEDVSILAESVGKLKHLAHASNLSRWHIMLDHESIEECRGYQKSSQKRFWECMIKMYTLPENHHAGTCKMGPSTDNTAVVDPRLKVHGIENVRVIDASIFPSQVNSNTIGPTLMVAEKGSQFIKEAWDL